MIKDKIRKITPVLSVYHFLFAFFGALFHGFPSRKVKVFAVTGTNGKTTTVNIIAKIFEEAGYKVASFSSTEFIINGKAEPNRFKMTMPGRAVIQKLLKRAAREGCQIAIMEVTSEGIKQHRHRFINFHSACFTNLSPEHIESHGGFENYKKEKGKLFSKTRKRHVINADDEHADYFLSFSAEKKLRYSIRKDSSAEIKAEDVKGGKEGVSFFFEGEEMLLPLMGKFNVYNALVAIALAREEKISKEVIKRGLRKIGTVSGRMEEVVSSPFKVVIDYAVTPVTLEGVYKEIKEILSPRKLICVLGSCGGGRDKWKRPVLGEIADKYCDKAIITNEDPYDEDPQEIIDQIEGGFSKITNSKPRTPKYEKILERREAIKRALEVAKEGDVVVVTGKGSEVWMCLARGEKIPWNEKEIIKEELKKLNIK